MVDCQVLNYIKAYVLWDFVQFYLEHTCPFEVGYKRVALVCNEGANSTTLDRWDMVTARVCYVSLMVILHTIVQVLRDGAYDFPSSSEKTINFN